MSQHECFYNYKLPLTARPKELVAQIWLDITQQLRDVFPSISLTKDLVANKWQNRKDSMMRYHKLTTSGRSGQAPKFMKFMCFKNHFEQFSKPLDALLFFPTIPTDRLINVRLVLYGMQLTITRKKRCLLCKFFFHNFSG